MNNELQNEKVKSNKEGTSQQSRRFYKKLITER